MEGNHGVLSEDAASELRWMEWGMLSGNGERCNGNEGMLPGKGMLSGKGDAVTE